VHIPVILSEEMDDLVYNTFEVGAGSDVLIVAGCGVHTPAAEEPSMTASTSFSSAKAQK
jgi:hypothetical protein